MPLPAFSISSGPSASPSSKPPVEIVSIDAVVLHGVEIVSGGRTLTGDVEVVPEGKGLTLKKVALVADSATIDVTGRITDLSGPVGDVAIKAGALNFDQLLAFANDFANGTGMRPDSPASAVPASSNIPSARPAGAPPMNLAVSLEATRATMGSLALDKLAGKARITPDAITLAPIHFGVFGGSYDGSLVFTLSAMPDFKLNAALSGVDVAAATAFAGSPGTITGRLSGRLNLTGHGMEASSVLKAAHGTARVDIVNGAIENLGLIRTIVVATSGRSDASTAGSTRNEPFTKLGATLTIANGSASTQDLRFESKDLLLAAAGTVRLDGSAINLPGQVQLSDDSVQTGRTGFGSLHAARRSRHLACDDHRIGQCAASTHRRREHGQTRHYQPRHRGSSEGPEERARRIVQEKIADVGRSNSIPRQASDLWLGASRFRAPAPVRGPQHCGCKGGVLHLILWLDICSFASCEFRGVADVEICSPARARGCRGRSTGCRTGRRPGDHETKTGPGRQRSPGSAGTDGSSGITGLEHCDKPMGAIAVVEPQDTSWRRCAATTCLRRSD